MKNKKKKVIKALLLSPMAVVVLSVIYPALSVLFIWINTSVDGLSVDTDWVEACSIVSVNDSAISIISILLLQLMFILPIWLGLAKSAIYLLFTHMINYIAVGLWFMLIANVYLFCKPGSNPDAIFTPSIAIFVILSLSTFFYFIPKFRGVMELNPHIYDFDKMIFHSTGTLIRPDGKDNNKVATNVIVVSLFGAIFAKGYYQDSYSFSYVPYAVWLIIAFIFIGVLALNSLYFIFRVHIQNRNKGKKMLVAELLK